MSLSGPVATIKRTVTYCFSDVMWAYLSAPLKVCDAAAYFEDAIVCAGRQTQTRHRLRCGERANAGAEIGNGHWNKEGHRVAGELLTQKLCNWLSQSTPVSVDSRARALAN